MRLVQMTGYFLEGRERRGLGMVVKNEDGVTTLRYNGDKLATITNRTGDDFTLTLHSYKCGYGGVSYANRITAIFGAIKGEWEDKRYMAYRRWGQIRIWDYILRLQITLDKDINFTVKNNKAALDYTLLERVCLTDETEQPKAITNNNPATDNSSEAINNLMALVAAL